MQREVNNDAIYVNDTIVNQLIGHLVETKKTKHITEWNRDVPKAVGSDKSLN